MTDFLGCQADPHGELFLALKNSAAVTSFSVALAAAQ